MITYDCEQGSEQWHRLRLGRATASRFGDIITPAQLKLSKTAEKYMFELLAEWVIGQPADLRSNQFMDRGTELEPEARKLYALINDVKVDQVGFCTTDDGMIGCSPDGLIGDTGGLEIKCAMAPGQVEYLLDAIANGGQAKFLYEKYRLQVQGALYVTGRAWWDIVAYNPKMPLAVYRAEPEPGVIKALHENLQIFTQNMLIMQQRLIDAGIVPFEERQRQAQEEADKEFEDITGFQA